MRFLESTLPGQRIDHARYLRTSFCVDARLSPALLTVVDLDDPLSDALALAERLIDERRPAWETQEFPQLRALRDYFAFLGFAVDARLIVTVCTWRQADESYRLHGVYDADSGAPVWSHLRGESLRGDLNRRLGETLVLEGPHDDWPYRNDAQIAGISIGPRLPVIQFSADQQIENILTVEAMARAWPYAKHWERLYPGHPARTGA
jgi:hypothetical protein